MLVSHWPKRVTSLRFISLERYNPAMILSGNTHLDNTSNISFRAAGEKPGPILTSLLACNSASLYLSFLSCQVRLVLNILHIISTESTIIITINSSIFAAFYMFESNCHILPNSFILAVLTDFSEYYCFVNILLKMVLQMGYGCKVR